MKYLKTLCMACFLKKKIFFIKIFFLPFFSFSLFAEGKLNVLTGTTNLKSLLEEVAGDRVYLKSIIKGPQDPHFLSPKPSYMLKAKRSDLFVFIGMDLEIGWLPGIIQGAKNPKIQPGQTGYLNTSQFIEALSVPEEKVNRFFGDIHPYGNPHYLLDPLRAVQVAKGISERLFLLDPQNKAYYTANQNLFKKKIKEKMKVWVKRLRNSGVQKVVTYHSSFEYFLDRFQLQVTGLIEEKPGIPPSAKHILKLIQKMKSSQSACILMSRFYNNERVNKIKETFPVHIELVAIEVDALPEIKNYVHVIEGIVQAIENCGNFVKTQKKK